ERQPPHLHPPGDPGARQPAGDRRPGETVPDSPVPEARGALQFAAGGRAMKDYHINIFWSEEDGSYVADIPDLVSCSALGQTPEEVSAPSRREKNVRHGHISTLHIWWARRPLAACRAFIYASLVDDPATDAEREELLKEVADLASWDAVRFPERVVRPRAQGGSGRIGRDLLERARQRILACNGSGHPRRRLLHQR